MESKKYAKTVKMSKLNFSSPIPVWNSHNQQSKWNVSASGDLPASFVSSGTTQTPWNASTTGNGLFNWFLTPTENGMSNWSGVPGIPGVNASFVGFNESFDIWNQGPDFYDHIEGIASESDCTIFRRVFHFGLIGFLCILGLLGNTLSILILQTDTGTTVATFLLQALAVADNSLLTTSFLVLSISFGLDVVPERLLNYTAVYLGPVAYMSQTATLWTTVLLALNRYIAICRPFQTHKFCTLSKARLQVAIVFLFSFAFNFPRFFQTKIKSTYNNSTGKYDIQRSRTSIGDSTPFGNVYTCGLYTFLCVLIPALILVILNKKLVSEVRKIRIRRASISSNTFNRESNITTIMITIIVMVLFCHAPDRILQLFVNLYPDLDSRCGTPVFYVYAAANLLVILNSSTNFIIYYIFRPSFRLIIKKRLYCQTNRLNYRLSLMMADNNANQINTIDSKMSGSSRRSRHDTL